ncbi:hypothetical protein PISMIDRAFT_607426 [Pisolithus microcarpus 441]|uniref:Uncharacterized protein n=1 Tax=Pisolithus microcarpus 441 TaxID=765257 RepID=A0A0D0A832_9AGAM|nr:hypothetical protein PISMIDRAFT_607426 [Pisolithus microcarpus 441]
MIDDNSSRLVHGLIRGISSHSCSLIPRIHTTHIHTRPPYDRHVPYPVSLLTASLVVGIPGTGCHTLNRIMIEPWQDSYREPVTQYTPFPFSSCKVSLLCKPLPSFIESIVGHGRSLQGIRERTEVQHLRSTSTLNKELPQT